MIFHQQRPRHSQPLMSGDCFRYLIWELRLSICVGKVLECASKCRNCNLSCLWLAEGRKSYIRSSWERSAHQIQPLSPVGGVNLKSHCHLPPWKFPFWLLNVHDVLLVQRKSWHVAPWGSCQTGHPDSDAYSLPFSFHGSHREPWLPTLSAQDLGWWQHPHGFQSYPQDLRATSRQKNIFAIIKAKRGTDSKILGTAKVIWMVSNIIIPFIPRLPLLPPPSKQSPAMSSSGSQPSPSLD